MNQKISVLMCTYNAWNYLKNTIQSILDQTYINFELLILDNWSSDTTIENIKSFKDKRINWFVSEKNLWPYWWLNLLLKKASWEYIAIQDHDDLWHPEKLEKQMYFLQKNPNLFWCGTSCKMLYEFDGSYFHYKFPQRSYYVIHPSVLFKNIPWLMYDEQEKYMWDVFFLKNKLCWGEKKLSSIDEVLITHIIQSNYTNASFSWFKINKSCILRLFDVHGFSLYTIMALWFELMRKLLYPTLKKYEKFGIMVWLEQLPFRLMGFKIIKTK